MGTVYYDKSVEECYHHLNSRPQGLTADEALHMELRVGLNMIPEKKVSFYQRYIKPTFNLMILILLITAVIQLILGEITTPLLTIIVITTNIIIAMIQQYRVEKTLQALENLTAFKAKVYRDGVVKEIDSNAVVPGDILMLSQGDYVTADARVIETNQLSLDESILTGETNAVNKITDSIKYEILPIQKQKNMVFSSSFVATGNGKAIVVATGLSTEIGKISEGIANQKDRDIPLQKQMNKLATGLGLGVIGIIGILFVVALLIDPSNLSETTNWLVSLAVAAIPYNFSIITTIILLTGAVKLARKKVIIRKLNAIETMGRVKVICSDKTGTLTQNQMTVTKIYYDNKIFDITGVGYESSGDLTLNGTPYDINTDIFFKTLALNAILNNNADLTHETIILRRGSKQLFRVIGSPTEGALITFGQKTGLNVNNERAGANILAEYSFTSERKRMSKIVQNGESINLYSKGAPDFLIGLCSSIVEDGKIVELSEEKRTTLMKMNQNLAEKGLRTLAFAFRDIKNSYKIGAKAEEMEQNLTFLGLTAMIDPPREGVKNSIEFCNKAGIRVVMITGDHPLTARAIGEQLGIYSEGDIVVKGEEIANLTPEEILKTSIFARVAPKDKLLIIKAIQDNGEIVAMTGDGVNDALALEEADVGIAMGMAGTDVAKNASDLILTDDSFNTIQTAVYHGRGLFNNIRSNVVFLLVINLLELSVLALMNLFNNVQVFQINQLYFLYFTVHFFPPFGLMFDKYDKKIMNSPPVKPKEPIINSEYLTMMVLQIAAVALTLIILWRSIVQGVYPLFIENIPPVIVDAGSLRISKARTICLITIAFSETWIALEARSMKSSMFRGRFNFFLYLMLAGAIALLVLIFQYDGSIDFFNLVHIGLTDWLIAIGSSLIVVIYTEFYKLAIRNK